MRVKSFVDPEQLTETQGDEPGNIDQARFDGWFESLTPQWTGWIPTVNASGGLGSRCFRWCRRDWGRSTTQVAVCLLYDSLFSFFRIKCDEIEFTHPSWTPPNSAPSRVSLRCWCRHRCQHLSLTSNTDTLWSSLLYHNIFFVLGGSVAEWLAC